MPNYELHTENGVAGFKVTVNGVTTFIYLNPSSEDSDGSPNVFLYKGTTGDPANDMPIVFVEFDEATSDVVVRNA